MKFEVWLNRSVGQAVSAIRSIRSPVLARTGTKPWHRAKFIDRDWFTERSSYYFVQKVAGSTGKATFERIKKNGRIGLNKYTVSVVGNRISNLKVAG